MSGATKNTSFVMRRTSRTGMQASATLCGPSGGQQFVIQQKQGSHEQGLGSTSATKEFDELVGEFRRQVDFFVTRSS